jgi:hypothetical protein
MTQGMRCIALSVLLIWDFSLLHVPPSYLCHTHVCSCFQSIHFILDPHFPVDCHGFILLFVCQQTASFTLTCWHYCHYLNDSTASLLLFLVPIIVVISHRFWCFFGNFLIFLHSASLVLLFCLAAWFHFPLFSLFHCFLLYELFINMYALFVIRLIIT